MYTPPKSARSARLSFWRPLRDLQRFSKAGNNLTSNQKTMVIAPQSNTITMTSINCIFRINRIKASIQAVGNVDLIIVLLGQERRAAMEFVVIWIGETGSGFAIYLNEESAQKAAAGLRSSDLFVVVRRLPA
jgi:hypothetical protein